MLAGLDATNRTAPLLVLCCTNSSAEAAIYRPASERLRPPPSTSEIARRLGLGSLARSWAAYEVDIVDMCGMVRALEWALYRVQRARGLGAAMREAGAARS